MSRLGTQTAAIRQRIDETKSARAFERAVLTAFMAGEHLDNRSAIARKLWPDDDLTPRVLERSAVTVASTGVSGWASELAANSALAFLSGLQPLSAASALIASGLHVDLPRSETATLPQRSTAPSPLPWVGEGQPIPTRQSLLEALPYGPSRKFALLIGFTREIEKRGGAMETFSTILREDAAASLDAGYFSTAAGDAVTHPGLLYGAPTTTGFGGGDDAAMWEDLRYLIRQVATGGSGQVVFIASPSRAVYMSMRTDIAPTVLPSSAVADDRLIAVDPLALFHAFEPTPDIDVSREAVVSMRTDPGEIVSGTGPTTTNPVRSYWQTDATVLRVIMDAAFGKRRAAAVAYVDGVTW